MPKKAFLPPESALPPELRSLVSESAAILGEVIERESGRRVYAIVESLRSRMARTRDQADRNVAAELSTQLERLRALSLPERQAVARAFTFFLELMNACENAYRSHRLSGQTAQRAHGMCALVYVLTAHPTESRSPANIAIFQELQRILQLRLDGGMAEAQWQREVRHQLGIAWRASPMRRQSPRVKDEAAHIYHIALRPEVLRTILATGSEIVPVYLRTWVGGDKDGHPGVNDGTLRESLSLSRGYLLHFALAALQDVSATLHFLPGKPIVKEINACIKAFRSLRVLIPGDGARAAKAKRAFLKLRLRYEKEMGVLHPRLAELRSLLHVFPGLVVPLELREASDVLMAGGPGRRAIERMLATVGRLSRGGSARWYARSFIVSMASELEHMLAAESLARRHLGKNFLPVVPLFETAESLAEGPRVVTAMIKHPRLGKLIRGLWGGQMEIMVGYSDSSKQAGVWPSRLAIATAMHALEKTCARMGVRPVFFQGSGGSVDRGGGSVQDQVAWWPRSALTTYKVTIQGEMVERSLANPEITRGQLQRIASSAAKALERKPAPPHSPALTLLSDKIKSAYREKIHDKEFLALVGAATPYTHLSTLKIGSRPTRRTKEISVEGLRAIPWVLCWTQTRVLFQTWWGVGSAWKSFSAAEKKALRAAFSKEPVFASYVKALGFTLAKVEMPVWETYVRESGLNKEIQDKHLAAFHAEYQGALAMVRYISGSPNLLWFQPWLGASIRLRAPMIHPLNLLQLLAIQSNDHALFRTTATGISSGMMTTG